MGLERQDIERRDFPIGRRGYEPDAVDTHLRRLAEEVEELRRAGRPSAATLAGTASDQVRAIVEAAESTADDIRREAEEQAEQIRADATQDSRAQVARVKEAVEVLLERVNAVEGELGTLLAGLRSGANRLSADLTLLEGNMGALRGATVGDQEAEAPGPALEEEADADVAEVAADETPVEEPTVEAATADASGNGDDAEGARLIALNMALNGTPREETDEYLAENFQLEDRKSLLDEVYARVD